MEYQTVRFSEIIKALDVKADGVNISANESYDSDELFVRFSFSYYAIVKVEMSDIAARGVDAIADSIPTGIKILHEGIRENIAKWNVK